jgi:RNA polymerase sigma-70 factor (ECF subfamily)
MVDIDRVTVEQAKKGDSAAFRRLYNHYAPFVWRIVYRTAGSDKELAGEVVQETFISIHRSIRKFSHGSSLGTWIYRIALNAAHSHLAKRARLRKVTIDYDDEIHGSGFAANGYDGQELVEKVLATLSIEDRFLLVAREIDGMSFEEIALITGKSPEALRIRMFRLKDRIAGDRKTSPLLMEVTA